MSKDTPEVGDVWRNKLTFDRVQIKLSLSTIIYAWHKVGDSIYTYDFDKDKFLQSFDYLGKSKARIEQLFEVENDYGKVS